MNQSRITLAVALQIGPRVPPRELRLFKFGQNSTRKGVFALTERGAKQIMKAYAEHNSGDRPILIDWDHGSLKSDGAMDRGKAAGWADLSLRGDGIWLTRIEWKTKAREYLTTGEFRYFSPAFDINVGDAQVFEKPTNEIVEVVNCALTNLPATDKLDSLVAASRPIAIAKPGNSDTRGATRLSKEKIMKAHPLAKHLKEFAAKHELTQEDCGKKMGIGDERMKKLSAGHPPTQEEMKKCSKHLSAKSMEACGYKASTDHDDAYGQEKDKTIKNKDDEEHEAASLDGMPTETMVVPHEDSADFLSGMDEASEDQNGQGADEANPDRTNEEPQIANFKTSKVKASREDAEDFELDADGNISDDSLVALTGRSDPKEQRQELLTLKRKAAMYDKTHETVEQLKRESLEREYRELIVLGRSEGKLNPNREKLIRKMPIALAREYVADLSALPGASVDGGEEIRELAPNTISGVKLTREEIQVNELMGGNLEEYAEFKKTFKSAPMSDGKIGLSGEAQARITASFLGKAVKPITASREE